MKITNKFWVIEDENEAYEFTNILEALDDKDKEIERFNNIINELENYFEEEQDKLATFTSNIYEDSLGNTKLVNEDVFNEITKIKDKLKELKEKA